MSDSLIQALATYAWEERSFSQTANQTARLALLDAMGCGLLALGFPACRKVLGTYWGTEVNHGVKVFGTGDEVDPVKAAFDIGTMVRWLDYNDTWLAAEWGHPSDNLGAILAAADFMTRIAKKTIKMQQILNVMIKAYEIQGVMALNHSFNRVGLDHVILVKLASVAVIAKILGLNQAQTEAAISQCFVDGQSLRTYRHAPNTGSRKSWAAGDACARAMQLVWLTQKGEAGYQTPISAPIWGFQEVLFKKQVLQLARPLNDYVMEHILFKIAYPAEFHAQTAVEAAIQLHAQLNGKIDEIEKIEIHTHEAAMRIISKKEALNNPADRDHCLEYMIAVALINGDLKAEHYEDHYAKAHPEIDLLRAKMFAVEDKQYSLDYLDETKRSIANRIVVHLKNAQVLKSVAVEYPIGHKRRREEGIPLLIEKFKKNASSFFEAKRVTEILDFFEKPDFADQPFQAFYELFF